MLTPAPSLLQLMEELDEKKQAVVDSFVAQFGLDLQHIRQVLEKHKVCVPCPFSCCHLRPYFIPTFHAYDSYLQWNNHLPSMFTILVCSGMKTGLPCSSKKSWRRKRKSEPKLRKKRMTSLFIAIYSVLVDSRGLKIKQPLRISSSDRLYSGATLQRGDLRPAAVSGESSKPPDSQHYSRCATSSG